MALQSPYLSRIIQVGNLSLGGNKPVRIQSMTNTKTSDTDACVRQISELYEAGCEIVRLTARNMKEADNLAEIRRQLDMAGIGIPLAADVHFNPKVAERAAAIVQKVRINPGNYIDHQYFLSRNKKQEQTAIDPDKIKEMTSRLVTICKENNTVIRVGVNHGSLSERIMEQHGNTARGMVASAMEFLIECMELQFNDLVVSMKSSHVATMVDATLGVIQAMQSYGMNYPLHLGVTEAGEGFDGRIRSAAGIGPLLSMGLGDTIRVSLTEDPVAEIPVAKKLVSFYEDFRSEGLAQLNLSGQNDYNYKNTTQIGMMGAENDVAVIASSDDCSQLDPQPDFCYFSREKMVGSDNYGYGLIHFADPKELRLFTNVARGSRNDDSLFLTTTKNTLPEIHEMFSILEDTKYRSPVAVQLDYNDEDEETLMLSAAADLSSLILNNYGNAYCISQKNMSSAFHTEIVFSTLQATGRRISGTEYISCPSCGRTSFDIQGVLKEVKERTAGLKNTRIAVMGCIVNGPGEMAEADYGIVGAQKGFVTLYQNGAPRWEKVPIEHAVTALLDLIAENLK